MASRDTQKNLAINLCERHQLSCRKPCTVRTRVKYLLLIAPRVFPKKMVPRFVALCLSVLLHLSVGARSSSGYLCGGRAGVGPTLTEAPRVARIPPGEEPASVPDSLWVELRWEEPENADAVVRYMVGVTMEEDGLKGRERVVHLCISTASE